VPTIRPVFVHKALLIMIRLLPAPVRGVLATFALVLNTLFWCWFLFVASLLKVLLPWTAARRRLRDFAGDRAVLVPSSRASCIAC
jgi:hypothetical protein